MNVPNSWNSLLGVRMGQNLSMTRGYPRAAQSNLTEKIVSRPAPNFQQQSPRSPTFSPHVRDNIRKDSSPTRPTYSFSPQESKNARPQQRSSLRSFSASYSSSPPRNNRNQRYFQKSSSKNPRTGSRTRSSYSPHPHYDTIMLNQSIKIIQEILFLLDL